MTGRIDKHRNYYYTELERLTEKMERLARSVGVLAADNAVLTCREQVLRSLSHKQAWMGHVLQSLQEHQDQEPHVLMSTVLPANLESSALQMVRSASAGDWEHARTTTTQGWCVFFSKTVAQLLAYQAILLREQPAAGKAVPGELCCTSSTTTPTASNGSSLEGSSSSSWATRDAAAAATRLVDSFLTRLVLSFLVGDLMSYRRATLIDMSTGKAAAETPASHWVAAVTASKLSTQQAQRLQAIYVFFTKQKRALKEQQLEANSGLAMATACRVQQLNSSAAAVPADSAVTQTEEALAAKFAGMLQNLHWLNLLVALEVLDVLTHAQRRQWLIGSYPLLPRVAALLEAVHIMQQQAPQQDHAPRQLQQRPQEPGGARPAAAPGGLPLLLQDAHLAQLQRRQTQLSQQRSLFWARHDVMLQQLSQTTGRDVASYLGLTR